MGGSKLGPKASGVILRLATGPYRDKQTPGNGWEKSNNGPVTDPFDDDELLALVADLKINDLSVFLCYRQKVTDGGTAALLAQPVARKLVSIELAECDAGDEVAKAAAALPLLTSLSLNDTKVTNAGVKHLAEGTRGLTDLRLANTGVTDVAIPDLAKLKLLTVLDLNGTKVTEAGANELAAALPKCLIRYGDDKVLGPKK